MVGRTEQLAAFQNAFDQLLGLYNPATAATDDGPILNPSQMSFELTDHNWQTIDQKFEIDRALYNSFCGKGAACAAREKPDLCASTFAFADWVVSSKDIASEQDCGQQPAQPELCS